MQLQLIAERRPIETIDLPDNLTETEQREIVTNHFEAGFESDAVKFWPRGGLRRTAPYPEEALLTDATGRQILRYRLLDLIRDSGKRLVGQGNAP